MSGIVSFLNVLREFRRLLNRLFSGKIIIHLIDNKCPDFYLCSRLFKAASTGNFRKIL